MELLNFLIGTPLGYLMSLCLQLVGNYGAAILLFTLVVRVVLFPLSLLAQKNSIKMVKMTPVLSDIQTLHAGNKALVAEEQKKLYKQERYSTFISLLPLLIQIPIILGLIMVIYNPLTHLLNIDSQLIAAFIQLTIEHTGMSPASMGAGAELFALQTIQHEPEVFMHIANSAEAIRHIAALDTSFFGLDLMKVPSFTNYELVIALASALSALLLSVVQNHYNVLQANAGIIARYGMLVFLVVFSGYFALILPASLGLYWTATNLISVPTLFLCNLIFSPKAYMTPEFKASNIKMTKEDKKAKREKDKELSKRSKLDKERFFDDSKPKELVIYSESNGFYKYYQGLIERITTQSDIVIHYLTSDPNDQVFDLENPRIIAYFVDDKTLISTMMRLDANIMVMTTPDLETYHLKRSLINKQIEYIYVDHGFGSVNLMLREHSLDNFDTIFCYGPSVVEEIRELEYAHQLPQKTLVKTGFELFDDLIEKTGQYRKGCVKKPELSGIAAKAEADGAGVPAQEAQGIQPQVLIAPSWQPQNILESCGEGLVRSLLASGFRVIVRPHPEYIKRFSHKMALFKEKLADVDQEQLAVQEDFFDNSTLYVSDLVVTDWSTIFMEFCYATKQPVLFIDTPPKIMNPNYGLIPLKPIDLLLREKLGMSLELGEVNKAGEKALELLSQKERYQRVITEVFQDELYEIGNGMQNGADYIIGRIMKRRAKQEGSS
ncbi:MAG: membrane protein insertase YidC [Coriobacteriia bacterium]|nr:membrane protein insertase YidC [Coriobacteriia bacterium]